jgi:hypothetical protein
VGLRGAFNPSVPVGDFRATTGGRAVALFGSPSSPPERTEAEPRQHHDCAWPREVAAVPGNPFIDRPEKIRTAPKLNLRPDAGW